MKERILSLLQAGLRNIDDIQLLVLIPIIWSLVTSTFFLDPRKNFYLVVEYPFFYYGMIAALLAIVVFSLFTMRLALKRLFFLIMVFGSIYAAADTYIYTQEPNITVGLFLYLFANSAYGFLRMGFPEKKRVHYYVQSIGN